MTFEEILEQAIAMLQRQGRVSYRALQRQFDLDDDYLKDLKDEIIEVHQVAVDHDGRMLVWTGEVTTAPAVASPSLRAVTAKTQYAPASPPPPHSVPEAERRQLTVMFCDLVGSTDLAGRLDPEDWRDVVRAYQETAAAVIQRYAGHLAQLLGDGLMTYFGYPVAHEDDAQRAVHTGLGIVEAMGTLNTRLQAAYGVQLAVRIGIHTGPVVVGEMGAGDRHEQLALGETPNIAARLEGLAHPNTVVISATTARLVVEHFACEDLGTHALRGVANPIRIARVLREADVTQREAAAASIGAAMLVGREKEMEVLFDRWVQSKAGQGQTVLLSGEAGIGKSRLVDALRARVIREGLTRVTFRCSSYHTNSALYPVLTHLEHLLQFNRDDTSEARFAKLEHVLETYRFPGDDTLPLFATLLALPLPAHVSPSRLPPEQQRRKTQEDLTAWMLEEAERQPVLVIWEDLQWIDPSSLAALSLLIEQTPTAPICAVLTYRPEFTPPWATQSHLTLITLGPLGPAQIEAMAVNIAEGKTLPTVILAQIVEKTDGVPLFVEEMTKAILESDVVYDAGEHYELTGPIEAVSIPVTLHDSLMARLDRLGTAKGLAQLGAVMGRQFPYELVKALTAYDETRLQRELAELVNAELLYQRGLPPDTLYVFKHALVQGVAYESLLRRRRQALHSEIAQTLERLEVKHVEEHAGLLAYHYARSTHQDKAITYALLAGDQAVRLHARAEATTYYEQALTMARALPVSPEVQRAQIEAILKLAAVGVTQQDIERDRSNLELARALAEALHDEARLARVLYWLGRIHYTIGNMPIAIAYAEKSLAIADRLSDDTLAAPPVNLMGRAYWLQSELVPASQMMERSVAQMHRLGNTSEEATAAGFVGALFGYMGEFERALAYADHGLRLAQEMRNPFAEAAAYHYRAQVHIQYGTLVQAITDCEEARRVAERVGDLFRVYLVKFWEGQAHTMAGAPGRGRVLLEEGFTLAEQLGSRFYLFFGKANLAACLLALGEFEAVPPLCYEAIRLAIEGNDKFANALAHRTLAEALLGLDPEDLQQAERAMLEAIQIQQTIGTQPELARSYMGYACLLQRWQQPDKAKAYLTQAIAMFQHMDMVWDRAQAEAVLRALS